MFKSYFERYSKVEFACINSTEALSARVILQDRSVAEEFLHRKYGNLKVERARQRKRERGRGGEGRERVREGGT